MSGFKWVFQKVANADFKARRARFKSVLFFVRWGRAGYPAESHSTGIVARFTDFTDLSIFVDKRSDS